MTIIKDTAEKQLDRVLSFFPRVDAKGSFLFALDTGLLALLALNLQTEDFRVWFLIIPTMSVLLYRRYKSLFPLSL